MLVSGCGVALHAHTVNTENRVIEKRVSRSVQRDGARGRLIGCCWLQAASAEPAIAGQANKSVLNLLGARKEGREISKGNEREPSSGRGEKSESLPDKINPKKNNFERLSDLPCAVRSRVVKEAAGCFCESGTPPVNAIPDAPTFRDEMGKYNKIVSLEKGL